jgi:hypothetical protein
MFQLDPGVDVSDAKTVLLGGEKFLVPRLMLRQTSKILPALTQLLAISDRRATAFHAAAVLAAERARIAQETQTELQVPDSAEQISFLQKITLSEDETTLMLKHIVIGLSRAYPSANADELYDLPIDNGQIIDALAIVLQQTSATRPASPGEA